MNPREYDALFATEDRHWWFVELRREISRAIAETGRQPERWLDLGSGTGGLLAGLPGLVGSAGVGLDASLRALVLARRRGLRRLVCASANLLPFRDAAFDLVTSVDLLCHSGVDPAVALREARRCLQPEGILVLQVPAFDWLKSGHDAAVWTSRRYRVGEISRAIDRAGLRVRSARYRNSFLFPFAAAYRLLSPRPISPAGARSDVRPASVVANVLFAGVLRLEAALRRRGFALPFGLSVFCVAERRLTTGTVES